MTVGQLIEALSHYPRGALVYVESEHGQVPERMERLGLCFEQNQPHYGDDLVWIPYEKTRKTASVESILLS